MSSIVVQLPLHYLLFLPSFTPSLTRTNLLLAPMESFHPTLSLLFLLLLLPLSFSFTPNASVFLDCGSTTSASLSDDPPPARIFDSDSTYISGSNSYTVSLNDTNSSSSLSSLYTTARVFTSSFKYQLKQLIPNSSNLLRLHFFPFSNLSSARFDVSALSRYELLTNFSVPTSSSPTIKEFFLWIDSDQLEIQLSPQANSLAFINAIEIFTAPPALLSDPKPTMVGSATLNGDIENQAMETMYRVNMGGPLVTPHNDTLWRTWLPDDSFLLNEQVSAKNSTPPNTLNYQSEGSTEEIGPRSVYDTARVIRATQLQLASTPNFNVNVTWSFKVDAGYNYLARMHFCDFISQTFTRTNGLVFAVYIMNYSAVPKNLQPAAYTNFVSEPFYIDFVVDIEESENLTVSISLDTQQSAIPSALLNGLEIMKMNNSVSSLSGSYNPNFSNENEDKKKTSLPIIIGVIIGAALIISIVFCVFIILRKRKQSQKPEEKTPETPATWSPYTNQGFNSVDTSSKSGGATNFGSTRLNLGLLISFEQIKLATNKFDEKNLIGVGGFGKVYKGILNDGTQVAVKRASSRSNQGYPEFRTEIEVLCQFRHRHLVSLIGYCDENSEMILVYEYMEKGTLRNHLYGSGLPSLSWKQRLEICIGAAKGLHYLHTGYSQNIIHRDVKSTNILLGQDYLAKVSDFGLSKLGPSVGETHVSTAVKGSFGYLDPEYFKTQKLTDKSDVYSFGVVLFEVLCARPVIDQSLVRDEINLAEWAIKWQKRGKLDKIIDPKLVGEMNEKSLQKFGETAEKCLKEYGVDRPSIGDVLWNLEYCLQLQEMEVRRDPHEDSGTAEVDFPAVPVVRRMPSSFMSNESRSDVTTSNVFSQLVSREGR
ncbi:hypothetical protein LUZ60_014616 [Juncus effusus]|nr:hypothetical protein LUZ60_014616 [Juncus effusus]